VFCRDRFTEYIVTQKDYTFEKANNVSMVEHLVKISFLKKISALGKVTAAIDFANEIVEQGLKIVVFAHHKEVIDQLMTGLAPNGVVKIDGGTRSEARNAAVQAFQHDPKTMAIVLSLNAASEGLTLTVASTMLFVEYPWTPGQFDQAEARCHRIGQSAQSVNIYNAVGKNTVDYHILNIIAEKRDVFNAAIGSDNDGTMQLGQGDIVKELIRRMNQEKISSQ
jgi:SWI/SNF-related matrix-associated actin-dependent regulator 1 of chromatin subfamily A